MKPRTGHSNWFKMGHDQRRLKWNCETAITTVISGFGVLGRNSGICDPGDVLIPSPSNREGPAYGSNIRVWVWGHFRGERLVASPRATSDKSWEERGRIKQSELKLEPASCEIVRQEVRVRISNWYVIGANGRIIIPGYPAKNLTSSHQAPIPYYGYHICIQKSEPPLDGSQWDFCCHLVVVPIFVCKYGIHNIKWLPDSNITYLFQKKRCSWEGGGMNWTIC